MAAMINPSSERLGPLKPKPKIELGHRMNRVEVDSSELLMILSTIATASPTEPQRRVNVFI
jgi:hypothetical protein